MINKRIKLVNVIQAMLVRRILPCQRRTCNLWEFDPAKHQALQQFFGATHEGIWKVFFKANETWPMTTEDRGYNQTHPASPVSFSYFKVHPSPVHSRKMSKLPYLSFQGCMTKAERIQCPAPLPENPAIPLLTKMLVPAPYQAP